MALTVTATTEIKNTENSFVLSMEGLQLLDGDADGMRSASVGSTPILLDMIDDTYTATASAADTPITWVFGVDESDNPMLYLHNESKTATVYLTIDMGAPFEFSILPGCSWGYLPTQYAAP
jgi:hypothetical protein